MLRRLEDLEKRVSLLEGNHVKTKKVHLTTFPNVVVHYKTGFTYMEKIIPILFSHFRNVGDKRLVFYIQFNSTHDNSPSIDGRRLDPPANIYISLQIPQMPIVYDFAYEDHGYERSFSMELDGSFSDLVDSAESENNELSFWKLNKIFE